MKNSMKQNNAITLIALVITIIVLLILAGVTIVTLTGDNGLLQKAQTAKDENEVAKELELIKLAVSAAQVEGKGTLITENLNDELKKSFNNDNEVIEVSIGWIYKAKNIYRIYKEGNVEKGDLIPNEYQRVEYVETTGSGYIDTEYVFKNKPKVVGEIMITSSGDLDIMGNDNAKTGCFIIDFAGSTLFYRYSSSSSIGLNTNIEINKWYDFEFSDKVKVNDMEKYTVNSYDFSNNDQTFYIGKGRNYGFAKFKEIKMYDNGNLVRDLVPCYRKLDNKAGMFDVVENKFYTDKSGGCFNYFNEYELPKEDSELEYIESKGSQFIDTEYIFKNKPKIEGVIMIKSVSDLDIMGNSTAKDGCFIIDFLGNRLDYRYSSVGYTTVNPNIEINKWYNFEFSDKVKVNGKEKYSTNNYDFSNNNQTFYIGKGRSYGYARFKEIKMYDGDILVRDLVPYYKKDENKVGMLDRLTNIFYSNKGTGEDFIPGPKK